MKVKLMDIKLPLGGFCCPHFQKSSDADPSQLTPAAAGANVDKNTAERKMSQPSKDDLREILEQTIELVSISQRNLKFEIVEDAGILQIQVINSSDGAVVRKIPPDEIVKLITYIKDKWSNATDVLA